MELALKERLTALYTTYIRRLWTSSTLYRGQVFVWDPQKEADNFAKHGIHFETACDVFFDQWSAFVDASIPEESRLALIGMAKDRKIALRRAYRSRERHHPNHLGARGYRT